VRSLIARRLWISGTARGFPRRIASTKIVDFFTQAWSILLLEVVIVMRPDLITLGKMVHELYRPGCECGRSGEHGWCDVVRCAKKTLLHRAETLLDQFSKFGYTNAAVAAAVHCDPSITSRAHGGGAELQLGLSKLLNLVRSLEKALVDARRQHFNMSIQAGAAIVQPLDPCSSIAVTEDLLRIAGESIYSNLCSILLSRPATERQPLPDGIEGVISNLGDPNYGVSVIQVEPTEEVERLKRQLHEIKHFEERLENKIQQLEKETKVKEQIKTPRARFT
jgi:hypothetical protein